MHEKQPKVRIKFEPRDLWVGVYWTIHERVKIDWVEDPSSMSDYTARTWLERTLEVYICVLPTLPIIITKQLTPRT